MATHYIHRRDLPTLVALIGGNLFGVTYRARGLDKATGERPTKRMVCRRGVRRFDKGGAPAYDAVAANLIQVCDFAAARVGYARVAAGESTEVRATRSFGVESVFSIRFRGDEYIVNACDCGHDLCVTCN
jgi:hypothetical protein